MFADRKEAGARLAERLEAVKDDSEAIVVAIPRGGVAVGSEIARKLGLPLKVLVAKKITPPGYPEFAIGAASADDSILDDSSVASLGMPEDLIALQIREAQDAAREKRERYAHFEATDLSGKTVIVTDDGIATGRTAELIVKLIARQDPGRLIVAIPVAPPKALVHIEDDVDEVIILLEPETFGAVGEFYEDFSQVTDEQAVSILESLR